MPRRRLATAGASLLGLLSLVILASYFLRTTPPTPGSTSESRLSDLRAMVERQKKQSVEAVAAYIPKTSARLDDLTASPESVLKELPGVVHVEVAVQAEKPTHRIVHLRDWHFVPHDLYAVDLRNSAGRPLTDDEVDRLPGDAAKPADDEAK